MEVARCQGTTASGKPCAAKALPEDRFCPWHSPAWADRRRAWSSQGGTNRSNAARVRKHLPPAPTPDELQRVLGQALTDVLGGTLEPGRANAAAALARSLMAVREATEVEERLAALEQAAGIERRA